MPQTNYNVPLLNASNDPKYESICRIWKEWYTFGTEVGSNPQIKWTWIGVMIVFYFKFYFFLIIFIFFVHYVQIPEFWGKFSKKKKLNKISRNLMMMFHLMGRLIFPKKSRLKERNFTTFLTTFPIHNAKTVQITY